MAGGASAVVLSPTTARTRCLFTNLTVQSCVALRCLFRACTWSSSPLPQPPSLPPPRPHPRPRSEAADPAAVQQRRLEPRRQQWQQCSRFGSNAVAAAAGAGAAAAVPVRAVVALPRCCAKLPVGASRVRQVSKGAVAARVQRGPWQRSPVHVNRAAVVRMRMQLTDMCCLSAGKHSCYVAVTTSW